MKKDFGIETESNTQGDGQSVEDRSRRKRTNRVKKEDTEIMTKKTRRSEKVMKKTVNGEPEKSGKATRNLRR